MDGMELLRSKRGLIAKVARGLGLSQPAISQWQRIPAERVVDIAKITGIPAADLRPDLAEAFQQERA